MNEPTPATTYSEAPARAFLIADLPAHERPRERLRQNGDAALSDAELLAILLRTGTRDRSVLDLSRLLLATYGGSLATLHQASVSELATVKGVGMTKALTLRAAFALARRLQRQQPAARPRIQSPGEVADWLREEFRGKAQEEFHALLLDPRYALIRDECVTVGLADRSQIHAREAFRAAIRESACRVLFVHNHPSGDPTPSPQDLECTRTLVGAGKLLGIEVIDHVILGSRSPLRPLDWYSFKHANLL
jgi:DNA repair protein RadC